MGKYILYVFIFMIQYSHGAVPIYEINEEIEVAKCVAKIIQRIEVIDELLEVIDVTLINVDGSVAKELHSLLDNHVRLTSRTFFWPNDTLFDDVYVIQCTNFWMFLRGIDLIKRDPFWNPRAKFIIIINSVQHFLRDISDVFMYNYVYDVALVVYDEVYTFGLEHDECDRPVSKILQLLSRCSEVQNITKIYVAQRKTDLQGCHVKFVSHNYWPFMSLKGKHAIEKYIVNLLKNHENITIDLVDYGQVEQFGTRLDNFTYTGMLHEIEIFNVEGAMGGYVLTLNRMTNMDFIYPFMVDHYKIVMARSRVLGKWSAVYKQLGAPHLWIIFGTFCIICLLVVAMGIFQKREVRDVSRDILIIWGYFLNNITQKKNVKSGVPYRMVLLNTLLFVFIISCAIQASLLSATTQPIRDYQPKTVEEVAVKFQLIMSPNMYAYLKSNPILNFKIAKTTCKSTLDCMMKVMDNTDRSLYTISSDIYHDSYIWKFCDDHGDLKIFAISESVATLLQTMYIRRGSSLAEPINRLLLRARSAGLIDKYLDNIHYEERLKYKFHAVKGKKPQSLKGLKRVFLILFCGYFVSALSFVIERWHKRIVDFFNCDFILI